MTENNTLVMRLRDKNLLTIDQSNSINRLLEIFEKNPEIAEALDLLERIGSVRWFYNG